MWRGKRIEKGKKVNGLKWRKRESERRERRTGIKVYIFFLTLENKVSFLQMNKFSTQNRLIKLLTLFLLISFLIRFFFIAGTKRLALYTILNSESMWSIDMVVDKRDKEMHTI